MQGWVILALLLSLGVLRSQAQNGECHQIPSRIDHVREYCLVTPGLTRITLMKHVVILIKFSVRVILTPRMKCMNTFYSIENFEVVKIF